ncbi:hypothetical protein ACFSQJ_15910 [Croceitalea marina]|uniref:Uncharacterized protein n=1 Tax=Croceitalea marina TaxID=1775166 RepID=A0ABW5MZ03_9FLAO
MESAETLHGIYLPVWFKNENFNKPKKYSSLKELVSKIESIKEVEGVSVFGLDVTKPVSPSKNK